MTKKYFRIISFLTLFLLTGYYLSCIPKEDNSAIIPPLGNHAQEADEDTQQNSSATDREINIIETLNPDQQTDEDIPSDENTDENTDEIEAENIEAANIEDEEIEDENPVQELPDSSEIQQALHEIINENVNPPEREVHLELEFEEPFNYTLSQDNDSEDLITADEFNIEGYLKLILHITNLANSFEDEVELQRILFEETTQEMNDLISFHNQIVRLSSSDKELVLQRMLDDPEQIFQRFLEAVELYKNEPNLNWMLSFWFP